MGLKQFVADFFDLQSKGNTNEAPQWGDTRPYAGSMELDNGTLKDMYRNNGIARKLVAKPAEDMTRNGWRIVIPDDQDKQAEYQKALDNLHLSTALSQEFIYSRLFGDGYASIGLQETRSTDLATPVDPGNIKNVAFINAFSPENVEDYQINDDPTSLKYGQESNITVTPTQTGDMNASVPPKQKIDKSRYFHQTFGRLEGDDYGNSIINTCYDPLKIIDSAQYSVGKIFYELTLKVFKSDEVTDMSNKERIDLIHAMSAAMTTEGVTAISTQEDMTKIGTPLAGVSDIIDFAWQALAASSNIPKSVLTGQEAGTLTGAQYDVINYYDQIKSQQQNELKPQIMQIVRYLMYATDVADGTEDPDSFAWDIEFNPLWDSDDETNSKVLLNNVQAATAAISAGIMDPDEAKTMLAGQKGSVKSALHDSLDTPTKDEIKHYQDILDKIHSGK
ncbi:hypothetical protein LASUN_13120 [Lentilactobacillus sunkii]|jgi:phage-related protein (TIGR01555 family)|uniref:Anti-CBASS protein Acb1-like N-terminal domain-containing protein n=1 Tax=Lentilactobacillus sunkii TaxID=481719 RepID=A0A1E7XCS5_9LACO|nr:anti-CBASS Acb1 family protein [Lentilactobacillus sunkii]OFA10762.1 hypothetical protein LASUN_13120 [Lentilactobacillus sunkii]